MERLFKELTPECEITARLYAQGYDKKEIADIKCRAFTTVCNQLQAAYDILGIRNGRELSTMVHERMTGMKLTMRFSKATRTLVAYCLLGLMGFSTYHSLGLMRTPRRVRIETEARARENDFMYND